LGQESEGPGNLLANRILAVFNVGKKLGKKAANWRVVDGNSKKKRR